MLILGRKIVVKGRESSRATSILYTLLRILFRIHKHYLRIDRQDPLHVIEVAPQER